MFLCRSIFRVNAYYLYDHLGNTRVVYNVTPTSLCNGEGAIQYDLENVQDYYPYGKTLRKFTASQGQERFLTTQHERDEETGLDYRGARFYDAEVGRFLSLDPLAADFASWSAYNYTINNSVRYVDPEGKLPRIPLIVGLVSGGWEYSNQVYNNYQKGQTGYDAWVGNVDRSGANDQLNTVIGGRELGLHTDPSRQMVEEASKTGMNKAVEVLTKEEK